VGIAHGPVISHACGEDLWRGYSTYEVVSKCGGRRRESQLQRDAGRGKRMGWRVAGMEGAKQYAGGRRRQSSYVPYLPYLSTLVHTWLETLDSQMQGLDSHVSRYAIFQLVNGYFNMYARERQGSGKGKGSLGWDNFRV
jgi:hypothetical protein